MKIFYCTTFLHFGAGRVVVDLALEALKRGHEPFIAATSKFEAFESQGHLIEEARRGGVEVALFDDLYTRNFAKTGNCFNDLFKKRDFDIIHSHAAVPGHLAQLAKPLPQISTVHAWSPKKPDWMKKQDADFLNGIEKVHAVSEDVKSMLIQEGVTRPIEVIYNGIDFSKIPIKTPSSHTKIIIGTTAHLEERKGINYLIEAIRLLPHKNIEVHILGDGPDRLKLEEQAKGLPIQFYGFVDKPYELMQIFDLFVLPSLSEGLPLSIVEAMYMGVPVVTTDVQGNREIGGEGRACLIAPANPEALAEQLKLFIETPSL